MNQRAKTVACAVRQIGRYTTAVTLFFVVLAFLSDPETAQDVADRIDPGGLLRLRRRHRLGGSVRFGSGGLDSRCRTSSTGDLGGPVAPNRLNPLRSVRLHKVSGRQERGRFGG